MLALDFPTVLYILHSARQWHTLLKAYREINPVHGVEYNAKVWYQRVFVCPLVLCFCPYLCNNTCYDVVEVHVIIGIYSTVVPTCLLHILYWTSGPVQYCPPFSGLQYGVVDWTQCKGTSYNPITNETLHMQCRKIYNIFMSTLQFGISRAIVEKINWIQGSTEDNSITQTESGKRNSWLLFAGMQAQGEDTIRHLAWTTNWTDE